MLQGNRRDDGAILGGGVDVASGAAISQEDLGKSFGAGEVRYRGDVAVRAALEIERLGEAPIRKSLTGT